jgi:hypothetical protein
MGLTWRQLEDRTREGFACEAVCLDQRKCEANKAGTSDSDQDAKIGKEGEESTWTLLETLRREGA